MKISSKLLSVFLALLLSLSLVCPALAAQDAPDSWYRDAVQWSLERGLIAPVSSSDFGADKAVTRGELDAILARLTGGNAIEADNGA